MNLYHLEEISMLEHRTTSTPSKVVSQANVDSAAVVPHPIEEIADIRLRRNGYPTLKKVSCDFSEGTLTLRGHVPTYYLKQLAQAAVAAIEGVERIHNQIEVCQR
jgi:osmotically-inducible protein OsmY